MTVSGQRNHRALHHASEIVNDWLDLQDEDSELVDEAEDELRNVSVLALAHAPTSELNDAVRRAREVGWGWGPIATLLCEPPADTRRRMA